MFLDPYRDARDRASKGKLSRFAVLSRLSLLCTVNGIPSKLIFDMPFQAQGLHKARLGRGGDLRGGNLPLGLAE